MKYLIYNTKIDAENRTKEIAISQGCDQNPSDITTKWFAVIENATNIPQSALVVPEDEEDKLTQQEIDSLKDEQYMIDNGWFNPNDN